MLLSVGVPKVINNNSHNDVGNPTSNRDKTNL